MKTTPRKCGHQSYWISDENLYETFEITPNTDMFMSRHLFAVKGMPDIEKLNRQDIEQITKDFLNK